METVLKIHYRRCNYCYIFYTLPQECYNQAAMTWHVTKIELCHKIVTTLNV
jgi:hypothetical protein